MRPLFRMWQEALAGFAPICRLPKDDCGTPRRPILCEPAGHTRIRTATSRVGRHAGNVFRISVPFPPGESAASLYACFYLKEFDCQAVVTKRRIRIGGLKPKCRPGPESGPFCRTNAAGRQPGMENPRNGRPEAYCCMADNKPTNLQKIRPPGCGDSGGVGRGPGPAGVRAAPPENRRLPRRQAAVGRMCRGIRCAEVQNGCAPCPSYDLPQAEDLTGRRKEKISPF